MRYIRQSYELPVPVKGRALTGRDLAAITEDFHKIHEKAYGYARNTEAVEFVNLRVVALGKLPVFRAAKRTAQAQAAPKPAGSREVCFHGRPVESPIYVRDRLPDGIAINGPAIVEQMDSTIVVLPGYEAAADRYGNLIIRASGETEKGRA
jgi:N-methylhydantoinase A